MIKAILSVLGILLAVIAVLLCIALDKKFEELFYFE